MDLNIKQLNELANAMGVDVADIDLEDLGNWVVLTDEEADEQVTDHIEQSLWAFTPNFLSSVTRLDDAVFKALQDNNKCEDNNDAIRSLVDATCGLKHLVDEAIRWDGRGHFLNSYDGNEYWLGGDLYAYRN